MSVPAFLQSIGPSGARRPWRPAPRIRTTSSSTSAWAPRLVMASTVASVSSEAPKPRTTDSPSASPPSSSARCEIDLSPGTRRSPATEAAGSTRTSRPARVPPRPNRPCPSGGRTPPRGERAPQTNGIDEGRTGCARIRAEFVPFRPRGGAYAAPRPATRRRAPARRPPSSPATRAAPPPAAASCSPATRIASVPPRSGDMWCRSKSSMLIPSAPSACVIPERTPGRSGTWTRSRCSEPGSGYARSSSRRRCPAASPIQRAR